MTMGCVLQREPFIYSDFNFEMLMLLAEFVKAETPGSVKLEILDNMFTRSYYEGNYAEMLKKNLVGLSVSEVKKSICFYENYSVPSDKFLCCR